MHGRKARAKENSLDVVTIINFRPRLPMLSKPKVEAQAGVTSNDFFTASKAWVNGTPINSEP